jgi:hypothetical protein
MREFISEQSGPENDRSGSGLSDALLRLERVSLSLRKSGRLAFIFTIVNLAFAILSLLYGARLDRPTHWSVLAWSLISGMCASALVVMCESWRKQGDALFEEISDELQWNVRGARLLKDKPLVKERPELQARVVLRTFARASDLPLIPGKFGPAIYVAVNLLVMCLVFVLPRIIEFFQP